MSAVDPKSLLRAMFDAAVAAANPAGAVKANLPRAPKGRTAVVAAGKASLQMARALEEEWRSPLEGFAVAPPGYESSLARLSHIEGGHPLPSEGSARASAMALDVAASLGPDDLFIALISGGGSALLARPAEGIGFAEKQALNRALLKCGAGIAELNCVRKHVSGIKGGRLAAAAHPARVFSLIVSDVPGDDPGTVASGPTVSDATSHADALAIIDKYEISIPLSIRAHLQSADGETVKPGDARIDAAEWRTVVTPLGSLEAAAAVARAQGVAVLNLGDAIEGESREVAKAMAGIALHAATGRAAIEPPCVILSGGETSVTVTGTGNGGRNAEFMLSLALSLHGHPRIHALAGDTDGIDGMAPIAGALIDPATLDRARAKGLDAQGFLRNNDGHSFFGRLGDQLVTGPTHTNVNDFRAILIL